MSNLLVNAAHNSPEGSVVSVSIEKLEHSVKTNVRDLGTGISVTDSEHVFSPFYRADTENIRRLRGLGLGLTMVQRIVELHGGQVGFDPNLDDAGVTFWFTLPTADQTVLGR
jgi:two-component system phosphate regulon sensor histidine kinase PhoR